MKRNSSDRSQDENAQLYELIHEYRLALLKKTLLDLAGNNNPKVLDVGCYPPFIFDFCQQQGWETHGVASQHEQVVDDTVQQLNIESDRFPWPDAYFDLIVFTEVIEHLPHSPVTPLREMARVLKPGGRVIITTPNAVKLHHRLKLLFGYSVSFPIDQLVSVSPHDGSLYHLHHREYTLAELQTVVTLAGLRVVTASHVCLYPPTRTKVAHESNVTKSIKWLGYFAQQLVPSFRDSLVVIAEKS